MHRPRSTSAPKSPKKAIAMRIPSSSSCTTKSPWRNDPKLTEFQRKVYEATALVPTGKVVTYKAIAELIHCGSSQAVGQALRRNPHAPEVPCHRVVKSDLTLGGFFGQTSGKNMDRKIQLLGQEGVCVDPATGKIDKGSLHVFD